MAATVHINDFPTGLTLTADIYPDGPGGGSDTAAASGTALTEATNRKTLYTYSESSLSGLHRLVIKQSSTVIGTAWAFLRTTGYVVAYGSRAEAVLNAVPILNEGTLSSVTANGCTLSAGAPTIADGTHGVWIVVNPGTPSVQTALVESISAASVCALHTSWTSNPADTSPYWLVTAKHVLGVHRLDSDAVQDIWTGSLTEAYRSTGATGTGAQLLYEILQNLTEFAISGTTKTAKKLDGSTTAKTYTLDSSTAPTSITETT